MVTNSIFKWCRMTKKVKFGSNSVSNHLVTLSSILLPHLKIADWFTYCHFLILTCCVEHKDIVYYYYLKRPVEERL